MELINATDLVTAYTMGMDKTGRESLVVVAKGTFSLPQDGGEPELLAEQPPLIEADLFTGEPGFSAALYESEFAPYKPRCDVIVNGSAYAPGGQPATAVMVGLKLSNTRGTAIEKVFDVVGDRFWQTKSGIGSTSPQPFERKAITYDIAFGGVDNFHPDEKKRQAYRDNPVGRGYHHYLDNKLLENTPLPNTQERGSSVTNPVGKYRPMGLGIMGRGWPERLAYAGTYDQDWIDNTFPFLPDDFDERYFQCAPHDQQCDYLEGGEVVNLLNLTPEGRTSFKVPAIKMPVVFFRKRGDDVKTMARADTLLIEPDSHRFSIIWRIQEPLKKNMFEIPQVLVGTKPRGWWRARELGKTYYPSLKHLVDSKKAENEDIDA